MKYYDSRGVEITPGAKVKSKISLFNEGYVTTDFSQRVKRGYIRVYTELPPTVTKTNSCHEKRKFYVVDPKLLTILE